MRRLREVEPVIDACVGYLSAHLQTAFSEMERLIVAPASTPSTPAFREKVAVHSTIVAELLDRHVVYIQELTERMKEVTDF